jgi:hypothetical protein
VIDDWYISTNGRQVGPLDLLETKCELLKLTSVAADVYVWRKGFENWLPLESVPELAESIPPPFKPPPAEGDYYSQYLKKPNPKDETDYYSQFTKRREPKLLQERHSGSTSRTFMWLLLQSLIIFAVVSSNFYYQWTPNRILPGLLGVGLASLLTVFLSKLRS